jgi:hypothetical protein
MPLGLILKRIGIRKVGGSGIFGVILWEFGWKGLKSKHRGFLLGEM